MSYEMRAKSPPLCNISWGTSPGSCDAARLMDRVRRGEDTGGGPLEAPRFLGGGSLVPSSPSGAGALRFLGGVVLPSESLGSPEGLFRLLGGGVGLRLFGDDLASSESLDSPKGLFRLVPWPAPAPSPSEPLSSAAWLLCCAKYPKIFGVTLLSCR